MKPRKPSVTVWDHPTIKLEHSQHGDNITYRAWCEKEVERMNGKGGKFVLAEEDGMVAVCRAS